MSLWWSLGGVGWWSVVVGGVGVVGDVVVGSNVGEWVDKSDLYIGDVGYIRDL